VAEHPVIIDPTWPPELRRTIEHILESQAALEQRILGLAGGTLAGDLSVRGLVVFTIESTPVGVAIERVCTTDWKDGWCAHADAAKPNMVRAAAAEGVKSVVGAFAGGGFAGNVARVLLSGYHPALQCDTTAVTLGIQLVASATLGLFYAGAASPGSGAVVAKALGTKAAAVLGSVPATVGI